MCELYNKPPYKASAAFQNGRAAVHEKVWFHIFTTYITPPAWWLVNN